MCYYKTHHVKGNQQVSLKGIEKDIPALPAVSTDPVHTGFLYSPGPVLKANNDKTDFDIVEMEWGFIPNYWKSREEVLKNRTGYKHPVTGKWTQVTTLNAKSEEMLKPGKMFREAALHRRCLILVTGFFEWRHVWPLSKRTGQPLKTSVTYPYYITVKDHNYFYMAGLWQPWADTETGEYIETFTIVTTEANQLMRQIHNTRKRMPTILDDQLAYEWLMGNLSEERILEIGSTQYSSLALDACSVAKEFLGSLEPEAPVSYPELSALEYAF